MQLLLPKLWLVVGAQTPKNTVTEHVYMLHGVTDVLYKAWEYMEVECKFLFERLK